MPLLTTHAMHMQVIARAAAVAAAEAHLQGLPSYLLLNHMP
jgi:hypothetical protein